MPAMTHSFSRPQISRKRSNSVPIFGLNNVSSEERLVLFSAAERATARRRRPVSVDSPGPAVYGSYEAYLVPQKTFNFSTPSRFGVGSSPLRHTMMMDCDCSQQAASSEEDEEITPRMEDKPLPPPPQAATDAKPVTVRAPSEPIAPHSPPASPSSPRRQVTNPDLKAYADGLFVFTQSRLNTTSPQDLKVLGLSHERSYDESPPPTPELEEEGDEIRELRPQRPVLTSKFSDWSYTTAETDAEQGYMSSSEPQTPRSDSGMLSPDSFFNVEVTPRVNQRNQWTMLSSARPSSGVEASSRPFDSPTRQPPTTSSTSDTFSYFTGFDSVTASNDVRFSQTVSPLEVLTSPYTRARTETQVRLGHRPTNTRSQPSSSASNSTPFYRNDGGTRWNEMADLSRPPSWLIRAVIA